VDKRSAVNVEAGKKIEVGHISGLSRAKAACTGLYRLQTRTSVISNCLFPFLLRSEEYQEVINKIVPQPL
jgi:hypothetical protein